MARPIPLYLLGGTMTTTIQPTTLVKMGARYWYATVAKVAHSFVADLLDGVDDDTLRERASELKAMLDAGPWADAERVRAELTRAILADHQCAKKPERVLPDKRFDHPTFRETLKGNLLNLEPSLANPVYQWAVDAWVRAEARVAEVEQLVELNPADPELALMHRGYQGLASRLGGQLMLSPKMRKMVTAP